MDKNFPLTGWGSVAVHAGHQQDPMYAHLVPIYASSTLYLMKPSRVCGVSAGKKKDISIHRWGNPTFTEAENKIAALETFGLKRMACH